MKSHRYFEPHNFVASSKDYGISGEDEGYYFSCGENPIWVPRQDQLQNIVFLETHDLLENLKHFYDWTNKYRLIEYGSASTNVQLEGYGFTSMEQLWLAFVMKEKYNKVWGGENWREAK